MSPDDGFGRSGRYEIEPGHACSTMMIGIRIALGGAKREIRHLILRQGLVPIGMGVVIGIPGSVAMGQLLEAQLVWVSPLDPLTFLVTSMVLIAEGSRSAA